MVGARARLAALGAATAVLAACNAGAPHKTVTVTVAAPDPGAGSSSAGSRAGSPTASISATQATSPSAATSPLTRLPGDCASLLPHFTVTQAIGRPDLAGTDAFVVGQPEKDIGRIAYLNCRYGVTGRGTSATTAIEIGISLYSTPLQAQARIGATVDDYTTHGATTGDTTVEGRPAKILTGGSGAGYEQLLLVVASAQRTVAVSVDATVAQGEKAAQDAAALAALALRRTGG
jgi:hypothetical protein